MDAGRLVLQLIVRVFVILLFFSTIAWPDPQPQPLTYSVEVELSQIVVRITDAAGRPVSGVTKADLQLSEDGIPQQIMFLDEIGNAGSPQSAPAAGTSANLPKPAELPLNNVLIIFDACNSGQIGIEKHKRYVREFLENFRTPNTLFCMILIKPSGDYEMIQNFTSEKDDLLSQLEGIQGSTSGIEERQFRASQIADASRLENCASLQGFDRTTCVEEALRSVASKADSFASEEQTRSSNSIRSLQQIFSMAQHVPGEKTVILVSEGMDPAGSFYYNYGADVIEHFIQQYGLPPAMRSVIAEANADVSRSISKIHEIHQMVESANASKMPVYWVNPQYGKRVEDISSESSSMSSFTTKLVNAPDAEFAMRGASEDTGGLALSSTDMSGFYQKLSDNIGHYYTISYKPKRAINDGRYHRTEVSSTNPNYRVFYARDFKDFAIDERIADQLAAAHDFPEIVSSFPVVTEIRYFKNPDGKYHVMLDGAVAYHDLEPQISGDIAQDDLHLSFIVRNASGRILLDEHPVLHIRLPGAEYTEYQKAGTLIDHVESVNLPPGRYQVSLAALDVAKWKASAFSAAIKLPDETDACLSLSSPWLASNTGDSNDESENPVPSEGGAIRYKGKIMNFSVNRIFSEKGTLNGFYQVYNARNPERLPMSVHVSFKLFRDKDIFINQTPEREITSFTDPMQRLISNFFSVPYKNLPPGSYELEIDVRDTSNGCTAASRVSFQIAGEPKT